jgi:hypothetical protein
VKKLFIDIETSPNVVYAWDLFNQNIGINQVIEETRIICVAYKFDDGRMQFQSEWGDGHEAMIRRVWSAVDVADALVHYNGRSFDEKHLNREFLQAGLDRPSRCETIDLMLAVKYQFRFASNKLAQVSKQLDIGEKIKTDFDLWADVLNGDEAAQAKMEKYNKKDVALLVELYNKMLPWIDRHPNVALYEDNPSGVPQCTRCGNPADLVKGGFRHTTAGKFQLYKCNACGSVSRGFRRLGTTPLREG